MSNQTLRELAKDYAKGVINKENYRSSRAELIKGIIAGDIAVKAINYEPPLMPIEDDDEDITAKSIDKDTTQIVPSENRERKSPSSTTPAQNTKNNVNNTNNFPLIFISGSVVIVISLIVLVVLFYPKPPTNETTASANNLQTQVATTNTSQVGEALIADFLSEKNWSESSLDNFITSWSALSQDERNAAQQTKRMQRMNDSIYKQFLEEKALSTLDSEKAIINQQKLIEFSGAMGLNDPRLVLE